MNVRINGIHHVAVSVPDIARARAYYVELLGLEEMRSGGWSESYQMDLITGLSGSSGRSMILKAGNAYVELFEFDKPVPQKVEGDRGVNEYGYTHFCLDVDDVDEICRALREQGILFHSEPQALSGVKTVYSRDPFGNVVEFQQIVTEEHVKRIPRFETAGAD